MNTKITAHCIFSFFKYTLNLTDMALFVWCSTYIFIKSFSNMNVLANKLFIGKKLFTWKISERMKM